MASLAAIRAAAKTTIMTAIPGIRGYARVSGVIHVPAFVIEPATADFLVAMNRGTDTWEFDVHVVVSDSDEDIGQALLDEYVTGAGTKSIRAAVFNDKTLGLAGTDAHIAGMTSYGSQFELATEIQHIGATLRLVVHTRGTE